MRQGDRVCYSAGHYLMSHGEIAGHLAGILPSTQDVSGKFLERNTTSIWKENLSPPSSLFSPVSYCSNPLHGELTHECSVAHPLMPLNKLDPRSRSRGTTWCRHPSM